MLFERIEHIRLVKRVKESKFSVGFVPELFLSCGQGEPESFRVS